MEVCHIVRGQRAFHRLTFQQENAMTRHAAMSPQKRFRKILETVSSLAVCFVLFLILFLSIILIITNCYYYEISFSIATLQE